MLTILHLGTKSVNLLYVMYFFINQDRSSCVISDICWAFIIWLAELG